MARHCVKDNPYRGVVEYCWIAYDHSDDETKTLIFGPYDSLPITKRRTRAEARDRLTNLNNAHPGGYWRGYTEIIEIRYEQVKQWEVVDIEFTIP